MSKELGLYIHIPFCKNKCSYCDFYSLDDRDDFRRYADALILHMQDYSPMLRNYTINSIYIGGGTPTFMPVSEMLDIIENIYVNFAVDNNTEFTIECNPATVGISELKKLRRSGVNRLSIGMQSAYDNELCALSRIHSFEDVEKCVKDARRAKFENINLDIMYGIPEQTPSSLQFTLETACNLEPDHISMYALKIEDGTPLASMRNNLSLPDDDTEADMYLESINTLKKHGFHQYEISNFSKEGFECQHNLKYWKCKEYLGLGPGAHSYLGGQRFSFKRDIERYMNSMENTDSDYEIIDENYNVNPNECIGEYVMLGLRTAAGINSTDFLTRFGKHFEDLYKKYLDAYIDGGFMQHKNGCYSFTPKGMYVSNYILSAMLDFSGDIASSMSGK